MKQLKSEEELLTGLSALYGARGYRRFRPGCFEDYSLYLDNIDFLISKKVITFSGAGGRLLALRPDMTLSVIRHVDPAGGTQKLFYTDRVYRRPADGDEFREVDQAGVEVIGDIDAACEAEVLLLACDTLAAVADDYIVDLSHMGYIEGLMSALGLTGGDKEEAYCYLRAKNMHDFKKFAKTRGIGGEGVEAFGRILSIGGDCRAAAAEMRACSLNEDMRSAAEELSGLVDMLCALGCGSAVNINFSIANSADYYNGVIFNGYAGGVPRRVLSGGRYDKLLSKMGRAGGAIGFALYIGELERYFRPDANSVSTVILYDDQSAPEALERSRALTAEGRSVRIARSLPEGIRYNEVQDLRRHP